MGVLMRVLQVIGRVILGVVALFAIAVFLAFLWGVVTALMRRPRR